MDGVLRTIPAVHDDDKHQREMFGSSEADRAVTPDYKDEVSNVHLHKPIGPTLGKIRPAGDSR